MTEANRCVHGVNPATMCEHCSRYYTSDAAAVEALTRPYELAEPAQPITPELVLGMVPIKDPTTGERIYRSPTQEEIAAHEARRSIIEGFINGDGIGELAARHNVASPSVVEVIRTELRKLTGDAR